MKKNNDFKSMEFLNNQNVKGGGRGWTTPSIESGLTRYYDSRSPSGTLIFNIGSESLVMNKNGFSIF